MKLTNQKGLRTGGWLGLLLIELCLMGMWMGGVAHAQAFSTTTVQGTVYLANGQPGTGTLVVSWPSFTTSNGQVVTADSMTVAIAPDGFVSVNLAPNLGASPAGLYYTAIFYMSDGSVNTQYWVVPVAASATLGQVQAKLMPATQAVQTVSKTYVDQAIAELAGSLLTASGATMTGPLTLCCDPTTPLQAADKHYVDVQTALDVPLTGGTLSGPLTAVKLGALYQVDQFAGADFGAKLGACLSGLSATQGGMCDARNFSGTLGMGSNLTIATANATVLLPCATISTANQVIVTAGTRNVTLHGCALRGASTASGSQGGTVLYYSGTGAMVQVGDPTYAADTMGFHLDNAVINITAASSASAQGFAAYRTQELDLESLYFLGNSNQTGMTLDGTGNYSGGTFYDNQFTGFQTAVNAIGHQIANPATTDWLNASTFVRLHIDCPTSGGNPVSGTYGINLQQGDGNTFTGGDVEGCATALHLGANAQNNTIVGLRNENSTNQVVADAGSSYNNWMTGGTMFSGQLTDNGTRNSFLDTFHRSFNGLNGDWYGSQKDATVTNHFRLGTGAGNERGLLNEIQTDYGYRWMYGFTDATAGEQFYQIQDLLNNVNRVSIGQYNNGQSSTNNQTVINAAGTGAVVLNGSNGSGTGGVIFGSGGASETTVATIGNTGNAQFNGTLMVGGTSQSTGTMTVRNNADAEVDYYLWPGVTTSQKGAYTYKDWNGNSQWYMVKDASNNWSLNSATGGLDSFKAYQSTNSGDTYIDTSNSTGVVRINYETGSGTQFKVYGGSSSTIYAAFTGTTSIQFPGLAASSGHNCLQVDNSGYITNTGTACGSGSGNGTVNSGTSGQIAYYNGTGTVLSGTSTVSVTAGGTGSATAAGALTNLGGAALTGASFTGPVSTSGTFSAANNTSIGPRYDVTNSAYGAKGDGSTDDTAAIQAAFNACYNGGVVPYGGVVEFPGRHTYNVSATINAFDSCRIEGVTGSASTPGAPPRLAWNGATAGSVSTITAFSITSNAVTFTAANSLTAGQYVDIEGLTAGSYLNRSIMQVSSTGLSGSQFTATLPYGWSNVTTTSDSGTATTVNVLLAFDSNARYQQSISNMELVPASTAASGSLQVDVYYGSRVDTGTQILNTWAQGATMYGYYFANGGINTFFDNGWRCDGVGISCIYWRVSSSDSFGIANGTVDNSSSGATSGGAVMLDAAACGNQSGIHFTSKNMKIEINNSLTPGLGVFTMYDCPSNSNMEAFWLDVENNWVAPASGGSAGFNFPSFVMSPANDAALSLTIVNGGFPEGVSPNTTTRWVGLPALLRSDMYNISATIPFLSYAPSINSSGLYRAYNAPMSLIGDVDLSQIWHYGVQASDFLYSDTAFAALPNATTLFAGQIVAPPAYWNGANGKRYALDVVYQMGTTGTPNSGSTTCTGSSGTTVLTCNSSTDLSAGQRITIGTDSNKEISYVDATSSSAVKVNLVTSLGSTYSAATALSFSAPVLGPEIQMPTKSSAAPTTLAWLQGDLEQNSGATANGIAAWVNVAAGTPGTWAGIPLGNSSGQISSSQISNLAFQSLTTTGTSGAATLSGGVLNIPQYSGGSMTYPGAGISVSTGSAWGTSLTAPASSLVGISDTQTLTNKSINASEVNSGTLAHAQLPILLSGDIPSNAANTSGTAAGFTGSLAGDVTGTQSATTVGKINGGSVPASANALSSNSSSQLAASTSHNLSVPANCIAASGSGTAYTCTTSPTFTPAAGDHIQFKADVANTGSATLAVNGATAATFKKWGGAGNLIANDLLAGHWISATFDGTYWQLEGQLGNANATELNGTTISALSGSGSTLALTTSPTFTGNTTTFANNSASTDYVVIQPGTTSTAYLGGIQLNSAAATPVTEWYIEEDTSYDLKIRDQGATTPVDILTGYINAGTNINSQGTSAVTINNASSGAGTGGFIVYEGGASYNTAAFTVTSSGNASVPGTLTAGGTITGGMGTSLSSATSIAATSFTSTGLALAAIPVSTTKRGMCVLIWEQNTAVGTVQFGIGMNNAPTDLWVINQDSPGTYKAPTYTTIASTTTTAVSAADAPSATATGYRDEIEFTLTTGSSNAVTVTVYGLTSSTSDALVIEPGSYCTWLP